MRRLLLLCLSTTFAAAPALAADLGTYRPGTPYHATPMPSAEVCASTCDGDAQCRGWNYVKPGPNAQGVCELQSTVGAPVASPISISGVGHASAAMPNNVVRGQTNTVRVGTTPASRPVPQQAAERIPAAGRHVVRQPVPQRTQRAVQSAAPQPYMQPARMAPRPVQAMQAPVLRPMLDGQGVHRAPQPVPMHPQHPNMLTPHGQVPQPVTSRGPARQRGARTQAPRTPIPQAGRPPIGQAIASSASMPQAPTPQAPLSQAPMPQQPHPQAPMPSRPANAPLTFQQAQASLYGSLHDDVRAPASNTPMPADPNAAIPTSQSRPVEPVAVMPLAGARR